MTRPTSQNHNDAVLSAGTPAPEFSLHTTPDQTVKLSEFRGQPVVLAFYPADWSPVCVRYEGAPDVDALLTALTQRHPR